MAGGEFVLTYFSQLYHRTGLIMKFQDLHARLVAYLSMLIRTGQLSERGLARRTDLSQPHVHNVLKGRRQFSMRSADQVLKYLHLDLLELVEPDDWIRGPRHG